MYIRGILVLLFWLCLNFSQAQAGIDFETGKIRIEIDPFDESIIGDVEYKFSTTQRVDSILIDARRLSISSIEVNNKSTPFAYDEERITVYKKIKPGKSYRLKITYKATPDKAVYFIGWKDRITGNEQVWTQGQGKYSSNWVPSFDNMSEKVIFQTEITFDKEFEVLANGLLENTTLKDSVKIWRYSMQKPMSSYLLAFAAGKYLKDTTVSNSGIRLLNYMYKNKADHLEPTYRHTAEILNFLEDEIGIAYPWQDYKQVPVRDFLYAGMENTGATIFSDGYVIDSLAFEDKNYLEVNAHEMAHQWFGNLVTEKSSEDHWLHEGFATYYALLAQKKILGDEHFYWKLFQTAELLGKSEGEALTDPGAGSLTFYEKGAWALVILRDRIGDTAFRRVIQNFVNTYAYRNATIKDFLEIVEGETSSNIDDFASTWLYNKDFPKEEAKEYLKKYAPSLRSWYDLRWELTTSPESNEVIIQRYWQKNSSTLLKKHIISKYLKDLSPAFIKSILDSGNMELRKSVAVHTDRMVTELQNEYESLLDDPSYITREAALFKLWIYFPARRIHYLDSSRDITGLPNYNLRILWLFLATLTQDFETPAKRAIYKDELFGYTAEEYPFEVRQNAFATITEVFKLPEENLKDLVNATVHHVWQFRSFARNLLKEILKDENQRSSLENISNGLNEEERRYLNKQLESK